METSHSLRQAQYPHLKLLDLQNSVNPIAIFDRSSLWQEATGGGHNDKLKASSKGDAMCNARSLKIAKSLRCLSGTDTLFTNTASF